MFALHLRFRSCHKLYLIALLCLALAMPAWAAPPTSLDLDGGWQVRLVPGQVQAKEHPQAAAWLPARVPGTVQTDLMAAGLVPDPFVGSNESAIQWVGLSDWQYRSRFKVDAATLKRGVAAASCTNAARLAPTPVFLQSDSSPLRWLCSS